mmetsp:Transcript_98808/g.264227  ORF Transcript_98808/g.264227 Transcript_98808/m.264227 type:complete len:213 (+) Transcript_98808:889-1527(+)
MLLVLVLVVLRPMILVLVVLVVLALRLGYLAVLLVHARRAWGALVWGLRGCQTYPPVVPIPPGCARGRRRAVTVLLVPPWGCGLALVRDVVALLRLPPSHGGVVGLHRELREGRLLAAGLPRGPRPLPVRAVLRGRAGALRAGGGGVAVLLVVRGRAGGRGVSRVRWGYLPVLLVVPGRAGRRGVRALRRGLRYLPVLLVVPRRCWLAWVLL